MRRRSVSRGSSIRATGAQGSYRRRTTTTGSISGDKRAMSGARVAESNSLSSCWASAHLVPRRSVQFSTAWAPSHGYKQASETAADHREELDRRGRAYAGSRRPAVEGGFLLVRESRLRGRGHTSRHRQDTSDHVAARYILNCGAAQVRTRSSAPSQVLHSRRVLFVAASVANPSRSVPICTDACSRLQHAVWSQEPRHTQE